MISILPTCPVKKKIQSRNPGFSHPTSTEKGGEGHCDDTSPVQSLTPRVRFHMLFIKKGALDLDWEIFVPKPWERRTS